MSDLVESLLALARLDESAAVTKTSVELYGLAKTAAKDASVADSNRKFVLTNLEGQELPASYQQQVQADAAQLRQVLTNLLANASRFSPAGASVEVAMGIQNGKQVLEVRDHGEGIPAELRSKVFERFFRADNSRNRETGGSGLGLSIVATIIERHQGTIEALETPGGGATFRVTLP
jgi:two-component system OmpR family sensor kinase